MFEVGSANSTKMSSPSPVTRQVRVGVLCVFVSVCDVIKTDRQTWPTAPENRLCWKTHVGVCEFRSSPHRSACSLILFPCGTPATTETEKICVGTNYPPRRDAILVNPDYEQRWQNHKYAHSFAWHWNTATSTSCLIAWRLMLHPLQHEQVHR